MLFGNKGETGK